MAGAGKRIALLALAAMASGAVSGVLLVRSFDESADTAEGDIGGQFAEVGDRATAVVEALIDERNRAVIDLTNAGAFVDEGALPTGSEVRSATDRSIAELTSWIGRSDPEVAALYRPALDALGDLARLRSEIDARDGPGSAADFEYANQTFQRYADLLAPLDDAVGEGLPRTTGDPALRQGLMLAHTAAAQTETIVDLEQALVVAAIDGGTLDEQDEIAHVAELRARFTAAAETIEATDHSPYRELVDAAFPQQLTADVTAAADAALAGEPIDIETVTALIDRPIDQAYPGLAEQARAETRRHAERLDDDRRMDDPEDVLWLAGAVLAGVVALAALVGTFVTASRRSPPVGPAQWPPPPVA